MKDFPIPLLESVDLARDEAAVQSIVEACCDEMELICAMKSTLRKYPGCVHWHFRRPKLTGTIEVTIWPAKQQLWITVQDGRRAGWIETILPALIEHLTQQIATL